MTLIGQGSKVASRRRFYIELDAKHALILVELTYLSRIDLSWNHNISIVGFRLVDLYFYWMQQ
jgi:hypothetical protein